MENNNNITIQKLEDAVTKLIDSYTILDEQSKAKDEEVVALNQTISALEVEIEELTQHHGKQNSLLDGLLGKVETIVLGEQLLDSSKTEVKKSTKSIMEFDDVTPKIEEDEILISEVNINDTVINPTKSTNKLFDEDKMNKILDGFD
jgi:FtsZ-binding cell division protein ZapB